MPEPLEFENAFSRQFLRLLKENAGKIQKSENLEDIFTEMRFSGSIKKEAKKNLEYAALYAPARFDQISRYVAHKLLTADLADFHDHIKEVLGKDFVSELDKDKKEALMINLIRSALHAYVKAAGSNETDSNIAREYIDGVYRGKEPEDDYKDRSITPTAITLASLRIPSAYELKMELDKVIADLEQHVEFLKEKKWFSSESKNKNEIQVVENLIDKLSSFKETIEQNIDAKKPVVCDKEYEELTSAVQKYDNQGGLAKLPMVKRLLSNIVKYFSIDIQFKTEPQKSVERLKAMEERMKSYLSSIKHQAEQPQPTPDENHLNP